MCWRFFLSQAVISIKENGWKFEPFDRNPMFGPSGVVLLDLGAKDTDLIVRGNEPWRLATAMWLHAGLIHLASNMYGLLQVMTFASTQEYE